MAQKRDDFLINLVITSQNLAEGNLSKLSKQMEELDSQIKNLQQSENKRTDTIRGAQRATADYSKENDKLISQNKDSLKANEDETASIIKKTEAVKEQGFSYSNFVKNLTTSINEVQRKLSRQRLDIDISEVQSSLGKVEESIKNVSAAIEKADDDDKESLKKYKEKLVVIKQLYETELKNLGIRKAALSEQERQIKNEEDILKARDRAEASQRKALATQERAIKTDRQLAEVSRKRAEASKKLIALLQKEEETRRGAATGNLLAIASLRAWEEQVESTKRKLEEFGASQEDINTIEENASRSREDRDLRLAEARAKYAKASSDENKIKAQAITLDAEQTTKLDVLIAKKEELRKEIELLGGSYQDLDVSSRRSAKRTTETVGAITKLRNAISAVRKGDGDNPLAGFLIAFRKTSDSAAVLSRKLGRLGLAIRGLVIVGLLAFMQSFVSVVGAAGGAVVALAGSLIYAAGALGGVFVSALAQAIPIVGLLAATFNRLSVIQEAVGQADLARKQAFGDTGAEQAATDAALQIAEAQRGVKEAQEGVTEARREAKKELEDLILKEREAELAFKSATLSQLEARRALRETIESGDVESVARDQLGIEESALDTIRARRELRSARRDRRQGQRGGVEGTETYKNAVNALADAQRNLAQAQRSAATSADAQSAAQRNLSFFLNELSDAERKLFKQFMRIRDRYDKVFRPITDIIINAFSNGLSRAEKLLFSSGIVSGFRNLAIVLGNSFERVAKVLTGPVFRQFFVDMLSQAAKNMPTITDAFILLANIFKNIALAAAPALSKILEFIVEKLISFNEITSDTSSLTDFFMTGVEHFESWINLIGAILGLIGQLMQASSDSALGMLESLTNTINGATDSLKADDSGAREFFEIAADSARQFGRVLIALGETIINLTSSGQVKALADIFTEMLIPGMEMGIKVIGNFALFLDKLLEIPAIAKVLQLGVAFFFIASAVTAVRAIFQPFLVLFAGVAKATGALLLRFAFFQNILSALKGSLAAVSSGIGKIWFQSTKAASAWGIISAVGSKVFSVFKSIATVFRTGGLLAGLKAVTTGLKAIPVVGWAIALAIDVVIGAFMALKDNFWGVTDSMKEALSGLGDAFENLFAAFGSGEGASGFGAILSVFGKILGVIFDIIGFISKVVGAIALLAIIEIVIKPLTVVVNIIANIIDTVSTFIGLLKKGDIGGAFKALVKGIAKNFALIFSLLVKTIIAVPKLMITLAGKIISGIVSVVWKGIKALAGLVVKAFTRLINFAIDTVTNPRSLVDRLKTVGNLILSFGKFILNVLKEAGKGLAEGLILGLGANAAEKIVNSIISIINAIIDGINQVNPFEDIGRIEEVDFTQQRPSAGPTSKSDSAGRGRSRDIDADTESQNKNNKAKKDATKFNLGNYKALNLSGGASKRNARLNNQLADSLGRSSRQHKRAQNLQEALAKASARSRRQQELYAKSVQQTARVEERYANSLARGRRIKAETNEKDRASVKIRENLTEATKQVSRIQGRYYNSTIKSAAASQIFNKNVRSGNNLQEKYTKHLTRASDASDEQRRATARLSRRLGSLNRVLQMTGENSRALGSVFKAVTNRILTEFNVKPLKIQLPSVSGMFKQTMGGGTQGFQRGGYFGQKGMRGPDDRTIMVAGGEAILTGNHQAAVDTAFSIANQTAGFPYQSLDSMFNKDKRPHASAKRYNRGGKIPGYAGGGNVIIPKNIPDADGALPGLDLMALILNKYFGLSLTDGFRNSNYGSDHEWGGAIDMSNGSSPTPQMDSAWFWLTKTLGGAKAGGFIENYSSGAIKQMLYRTNIGGNHFNHIHLALLESYARNASAVAAILEGKAVPNANGAMFVEAPKIKKPKIKGDRGAPKSMLQGQSDRLTSAANAMLKKKIQPLSGNVSLKNMASFDAINRIYPEQNSALGQWGGTVLPFNVVAALAQAAGMPGVTFAQIAKGESGMRPGATGIDPGGTKGLGLWMITTGYNDDLIAQFGGEAQMRNPVKNALAAKKIYDRQGVGAWYGTGFVTDFNKPYRGQIPQMPHNRGGKIPEFNDGGIVPGPLGMPVLVKAHAGETILPTHKYQTGGIVPRYQTGGTYDGIPSITTAGDVKGTSRKRFKALNQQIRRLTKKLADEENKQTRNFLIERIAELKDQLLLSKEVKAYNKEIKNINKDINKKKREIQKADDEDKKELRKELKELQRDLKNAMKNKRATVAFEGELYNTSVINEFILLISDRINSFMKKLESEVSRMAIATAKWTYKLVKVDGKMVVSRVNSAVDEAVRGLENLVNETGLIVAAIAETNRGEKKARARLKKVRDAGTKRINKAEDALRKARNIEDEDERKKAVKEAKKNLEDAKKKRKEDIQKLQTSIRNSNAKQKELEERLAENIQARYEQQAAIFEEEQAVFEARAAALDTQIEIATLQNTDAEGNLTDAGKEIVRGFYQQRAQTLEQQRANIQEELNAARAAKDIERSRELEQALLENQLALLQNTNSIKELDESVQDGLFDFSSTNWEQFRQAIFSNGSILPQFQSQIPQLATGGYVSREGLAYLHAAEVVVPASKTGNTGPLVDTINFTQPMEAADPVAISNQIGFKLSTLKSL